MAQVAPEGGRGTIRNAPTNGSLADWYHRPMTSGADGRRIRLLFATAETHPTHRADVRVLFGKYLPQFGFDIDLVATARVDDRQADSANPHSWGGGIARIRGARSRVGLILADVAQQFALFRLCLSRRFDGLVVRDKPFLGAIGWGAARLARIPFVYWMSFPMTESDLAIARTSDGSVRFPRRLHTGLRGLAGDFVLYRILLRRADYVFVQSPVMLEHVRRRGVRHSRVSAVPMGVDLEALPPGASAQPRPETGEEVGIYLGTLNRLRRRELETMVDATLEVTKSRPGFVLLVVGESESPNEQGWLRRYAEERGAGQGVKFTGWVSYEEGLRLAANARIGISPVPRGLLFDMGCPTKAIEYMALGLPVVCNDQPDQAQVVVDSGGGVCVALDSSAFASAIVELLASPARAARMGSAGRDWVAENRDYRRLAAGVAQALKSVCASPIARSASTIPHAERPRDVAE